jgi:hypothetical protein
MSQIEEKTKKGSTFTCPNASCGKVFTKPLRALNLQKDTEEPYDACPYCLTEIKLDDEPTAVFDEPEPETFEPEETETETEVEEQKPIEEKLETPEAPSECPHHLGYLSERSSKEQIPDECMMCKDIVACMLKKMKG